RARGVRSAVRLGAAAARWRRLLLAGRWADPQTRPASRGRVVVGRRVHRPARPGFPRSPAGTRRRRLLGRRRMGGVDHGGGRTGPGTTMGGAGRGEPRLPRRARRRTGTPMAGAWPRPLVRRRTVHLGRYARRDRAGTGRPRWRAAGRD